jgi:hypothetical protein
VVVDDLYIFRSVDPAKTNPTLVIDADAVLSLAISSQRLEAIAGGTPQFNKSLCSSEHLQLPSSGPLDRLEPPYGFIIGQRLRITAPEALDHIAFYSDFRNGAMPG